MSDLLGNNNKRIVIVSGDVLPFPGLPTTGAGLRAWGLGKGLEARGHDVHFLMPEIGLEKIADQIDVKTLRPYLYSHTNPAESLSRQIVRLEPEIIVLQHWPVAAGLQAKPHLPVVIDFHGPILLESLYQDRADYQNLMQQKLNAIATRGDYFTCAGEKQRHYFFSWLMMAGFDLRDDLIGVVPVCVSPDLPEREPFRDDIHFVYGGVYLPWQDPVLPLHTLLDTLEDKQRGQLNFFGGKHGFLKLPSGPFDALKARVHQSSWAKDHGMVSHQQLIDYYRRSHVAFDLMQRNPERELAFTTRTVEYLWCGLPVIYNNYGELADYIHEYDAGWTLDPQDTIQLRAVIEQILQDPTILETKSINAQRLAAEKLNWEKAIEPLDHFCRRPFRRQTMISFPLEDLHQQNKFVNLVESLLPLARRHRRSIWSRLVAVIKEYGKKILKKRYFHRLLDPPAFVLPVLTRGQRHGQLLKATENYLSSINVLVGTHRRVNTCNLILHLRESLDVSRDIRQATVNAAFLQDGEYCKFAFEPIRNSKERTFYFFLESPDAVISDAISLFAHTEALNGTNQRYENDSPVAGELVYKLDFSL